MVGLGDETARKRHARETCVAHSRIKYGFSAVDSPSGRPLSALAPRPWRPGSRNLTVKTDKGVPTHSNIESSVPAASVPASDQRPTSVYRERLYLVSLVEVEHVRERVD